MSKKCLYFTLALSVLVNLTEFGEESLNEVVVTDIMLNKNRMETYSGRAEQGKLQSPYKGFVQESAIQI